MLPCSSVFAVASCPTYRQPAVCASLLACRGESGMLQNLLLSIFESRLDLQGCSC